jgi:ADP-ribose pyrophosphatase YjhB (NUDIX family)
MLTTIDLSSFRISDNKLQVLLKKRLNKDEMDFDKFSLIGGMVQEKKDELDYFDRTLNAAVNRIIKDEIGVVPSCIEQSGLIEYVDRESSGWSIIIAYYCFFNDGDLFNFDDTNYKWVDVKLILKEKVSFPYNKDLLKNKILLPFDQNKIVTQCYNSLLNKLTYSSLILYLLPLEFSVSDIVNIFKTFHLDVSKQTVINRWIKTKKIKKTGENRQNVKGGKPAALYMLKERKLSYFGVSIGK